MHDRPVRHPTIKDVALVAGVSPSTVGRVIGGYGYTSAESQQRVLAAMRQLGYEPNAVARSLKSKRTRTIGYLLPRVTNPFFAQIAEGLQDVASAHGYSVILCSTDMKMERTSEFGRVLLEHRVDGIVLSLPGDDSVFKLAASFTDRGLPVVVCHGSRRIHGVDRVISDHMHGGYLAAKHLINMGHERIGVLAVKGSTTSSLILDGCRKALKDAGVDFPAQLTVEIASFSEDAGCSGARVLLMRGCDPTAIIASNDLIALGALGVLEEAGLNVPADMSVIGFDNTFAAHTRPRLTTIGISTYQAGLIAAQLLLDRIEDNYRGEAREVVLPVELVVRGSVAPPRRGS
ncbi:MAG: LacI family DNA-binding transcriptional regulator [Bacillota bacterium]|nr:LacI family DNA-binding transcriptional regulator [Bacillota bacterium]